MLLTFPLMAAIQEISARIGRTTGHGIAGNLRRHYSDWLLYPIVGLLFIANTINIGADLSAMGDALKLLVGGPTAVYAILFGTVCALAIVFMDYSRYVHASEVADIGALRLCGGAVHNPCALGGGTSRIARASHHLERCILNNPSSYLRYYDIALPVFLAGIARG